jgi:hypothetical protein
MNRCSLPAARFARTGLSIVFVLLVAGAHAAAADSGARRNLATVAHEFAPADSDTTRMVWADEEVVDEDEAPTDTWSSPRIPYGERILMNADTWEWAHGIGRYGGPLIDYNRVDMLRIGLAGQVGREQESMPRVGGRVEYAFGRTRWLYGVQFEQPLVAGVAVGASMTRLTDHGELQQTEDWENSLALLFARQDYRDYFEREGFGGYMSARLGAVTTASVHLREDRYRSLPLDTGTRSWFNRDTPLRDNPPIDDGEGRTLTLRFERLARRVVRPSAGIYHWVAIETAGDRLGGDFRYTRAIADVRGVVRLSPATSVALRAIAGSTFDGRLPAQRGFALGGVDGLRAHNTAQFQGDQVLLLQGEYDLALWTLRRRWFDGGLRALVFIDSGKAWRNGGRGWDVNRQQLAVDGGFGLATDDDGLRVYFAQDLQEPRPDFNVGVRLQRPF